MSAKKKAIRQKIGGIDKKRTAARAKVECKASEGFVYTFKIALLDWKPLIWRRIVVPEGTLVDLHEHIQTAMGWTNSHLHQFEIRGRRYGVAAHLNADWLDEEERVIDSAKIKLCDLLGSAHPLRKFRYDYDFGDNWQHGVAFEKRQPPEPGVKYPCCIEGAGACPPEDVGGVWGYADMLEALEDPEHPEHENYMDWIGDDYDPDEFEAAAATKAMRKGLPRWLD